MQLGESLELMEVDFVFLNASKPGSLCIELLGPLLLCVAARAWQGLHSQRCVWRCDLLGPDQLDHLLDDVVGELWNLTLGVDLDPLAILVGEACFVRDLLRVVPQRIGSPLQPMEHNGKRASCLKSQVWCTASQPVLWEIIEA